MTITARGVAAFCGAILAVVALFSLLVDPNGPWAEDFMLASWLPPIVLLPGAALAAALGGAATDRIRDYASLLWPTYLGLALYGVGVGHWWLYNFDRLPMVVTGVHTFALILGGALLAPFPKTRPAAFQMWIGYVVLLACWVGGGLLL